MSIDHIGQLIPDSRNARRHNPRNIGMLEDALHEVGAARSIVIDEDGVILAGNGVVEAAAQAGIERVQVVEADGETIIAVRRTGLTPQQKTRLALFDNRVAEIATWNAEVLAALIEEDAEAARGMFSEKEMTELLAEIDKPKGGDDPGAQIDKAEELRAKWQTEMGQLWLIPSKTVAGKCHRLLCGDSTKAEDVARLMGGERASGIVADPPYGMRLDADFSEMKSNLRMLKDKGLKGGRHYENVTGDDEDYDARPIIAAFYNPPEQFWFGADYYASTLPDPEHSGAWLVWDKRLDESADKMFGSCFELIWSRRKCKRDMLRYKWAGVFGTEQERERCRFHPNQKPTALVANLMERIDGLIADPYCASGTGMIAAEQTGRICYGMEIEPKYIAVALERLAGMGLEPRLSDD